MALAVGNLTDRVAAGILEGVSNVTKRPNRPDGIGAPLRRKEDTRLLTGRGNYASDNFPNNVCMR